MYPQEEQWYSAELKKEVERLSNAVQRGGRGDDSETASLENGGRRRSSALTLDQVSNFTNNFYDICP